LGKTIGQGEIGRARRFTIFAKFVPWSRGLEFGPRVKGDWLRDWLSGKKILLSAKNRGKIMGHFWKGRLGRKVKGEGKTKATWGRGAKKVGPLSF
jgi:hypothetical protein